jgi:hypothetical protein
MDMPYTLVSAFAMTSIMSSGINVLRPSQTQVPPLMKPIMPMTTMREPR